jgi:hypothetical protein
MEAFQNEVADKRKSALDQIFPESKFARKSRDNSKSKETQIVSQLTKAYLK